MVTLAESDTFIYYICFRPGLSLQEALEIIYADDSDTECIVNEIFISPPDACVLTDEDSGDEDGSGLLDNLPSRQLAATAEIKLTNKKRLTSNKISNIKKKGHVI